MEEILHKLPNSCSNVPTDQTQELYLNYSLEVYNISLEIAKSHLFTNPQSPTKLYITKLRQISCEFLYFSFEIEQEANNSFTTTPHSLKPSQISSKKKEFSIEKSPLLKASLDFSAKNSSFLQKSLEESPEIFYEFLKILIRTCILLISQDLNKYEDLIFKDLSLARIIYAEYIVSPADSEKQLISSLLNQDHEKLQIIGLFYLIDLELSIELIEEIPLETLIQSFSKVFELYEDSDNLLFDLNGVSKLTNIYLKAIIKIIKKSGFSDQRLVELIRVSGVEEEFRGIFKVLGPEDKSFTLLLKLIILYKIENGKEDQEIQRLERLLRQIYEENSKEKEVFLMILQVKQWKNQAISQEKKMKFLEDFQKILNYEVSSEEIFPIIEVVRNGINKTFSLDILHTLLQKMKDFPEDFFEDFLLFFVKYLEDFLPETLDFLLSCNFIECLFDLFETKKIKPKILMFFSQKSLQLVLFLSFSQRNYSLSFKFLDKLLYILQKTIGKNNQNLYKEALYLQLNNAIMLKNKPIASKLLDSLVKEEQKAFFQLLFELKFKLFMNFSKNQVFSDLVSLFQREDFAFEVFLSEIMEFSLDSLQIKLILEALIEILGKNAKKIPSFLSFWKENKSEFCLFSFFRPVLKELTFNGNERKEDFKVKFSQEKVKMLISLGNFLEDVIYLALEIDDSFDIRWIVNKEDNEIFEGIFWNIM